VAAVAAAPGAGERFRAARGKGTTPTCGAGRSAIAGARKAQRLRASCWAGAACWAERGARLGWRLALGRAERKGEAELGYGGKLGWRGEERRPAGRKSRREGEENVSFFSFSTIFQIYFLNSNFNSF